ncbi:MAG: hypothetical protein OHK0056_21270 [Bacteriovoracaceae bacterium]
MKMLKREHFATLALGLLLLSPSAKAQFHFDECRQFPERCRDYRRDDRNVDRRYNDDERIRLVEYVNQEFRGETILPLRRMLDLDQQYRGYELKRVVVFGSSRAGFGQATLLINGRQEGLSETLAIGGDRNVLEVAPGQEIGRDIKTLELKLNGNIYIDQIVAILVDRDDRPGPGPIFSQRVQRTIMSNFDRFRPLDVLRELSLESRRGDSVESITVRTQFLGRDGRRHGPVRLTGAELFINGRPTGQRQYVDRFNQDLTFFLARGADTIGRELMSVEVVFDDGVFVESVEAIVRNGRVGPGPGPIPGPRVIDSRPMRRVFGDEDVALASILDTRGVRGKLMRVEVEVENRGLRGQIRLCDRNLGTLGCSATERLLDGRNYITLTLAGADLQSSTLAIRGDLIITSVRAFLDR